MKLQISGLSLAGLLFWPGSAQAADPLAQVEVTVIGCGQDVSIPPTVTLSGTPKNDMAKSMPVFSATGENDQIGPGIYRAIFQIPAGNYSARSKSPHCQSPRSAPVAVFPPASRRVMLMDTQWCCVFTETWPASIAVSLPSGFSVFLQPSRTARVEVRRYGSRDGALVYFEDLSPGNYFLVVGVSSGDDGCLEVSIPRIYFKDYQRLITLTMAQVTALLRAPNGPRGMPCWAPNSPKLQ